MSKKNYQQFQDSIKYLTQKEWDLMRTSIEDKRNRVLITMIYKLGSRISETLTLRPCDIDFENGYVKFTAEVTKTKQSRTAVITDKDFLLQLNDYIIDNKIKQTKPIFNITKRRVEQICKEIKVKLKLQIFKPHTLRHTHVVHSLQKGIPINVVQQQVGHKRLTTTAIYSKVAPELVKEGYEKHGGL